MLEQSRDDAERLCGIGLMDPGAEPGGSTKLLATVDLWGRISIDNRNKDFVFAGGDLP